jgi:hypothetical protein
MFEWEFKILDTIADVVALDCVLVEVRTRDLIAFGATSRTSQSFPAPWLTLVRLLGCPAAYAGTPAMLKVGKRGSMLMAH